MKTTKYLRPRLQVVKATNEDIILAPSRLSNEVYTRTLKPSNIKIFRCGLPEEQKPMLVRSPAYPTSTITR